MGSIQGPNTGRKAWISTYGSFRKQDLAFHKASSSVPKQGYSELQKYN